MSPLFSIIYGFFQIWFIVGSFYFVCTNTFLGDWFPSYYDAKYTVDNYCGTDEESAKIKIMVDKREQIAKILELNKQEKAREDAGDIKVDKQPSASDIAIGKAFEQIGGIPKAEGDR